MPNVLKTTFFRELQFLENVLVEIPDELLKKPYAVMVQERIVELHKILFEIPATEVVSEITSLLGAEKEK
jgi:hypothetical protein